MPYTTDAVRTKPLPSARPVRQPAAGEGGDDHEGGLHERAEEDLARHVVLGAADLVQEVEGRVRDEERVGSHEQESAGEDPGEVRAPPRVDVEGAGDLTQRPGRLVRRRQPPVLQRGDEQQDEERADRAGRHEHRELVTGEELDQVGATHRRNREADPEDTGHQTTLGDRDLVRKDRDLGGEQRVEEQLGQAPPDQHDRNAGRHSDDQDADAPTDEADDHPRPSHAHPGRRAVAQPTEHGVAHHGDQRPEAGDQREAVRCPVDRHQ